MMAINDLIDQLAFGSGTPKVDSCLGLYLSPETIYISETHLEQGRVIVDHLVRIPVPPSEKPASGASTSTLSTDFLVDNLKLGNLIRQSMAQIRWGTKDVLITLSHHLGLLRYFSMPAVERHFWRTAVPMEAKKYIPIPFDVLSHDYQIVPLPPDASNKPRQGALIAVTQSKNISNVASLLEGLGLNLVGLEVAPCSVLRVWEALEPGAQGKTQCHVHFDGGTIRTLLADRGLPVFFRELFLGAEASLGDLRKVDLGGCVGFAQKQLAVGQLHQMRISGTAGNLGAWRESFAQELGMPVMVQDTAAMLGIKGGDWGGYASIGASLRFLAPGAMSLDLGRVGRISNEEHRAARAIFAVSGLLAAWFAGMGLFRGAVYNYKARELSRYQREPEIEAIFSGKSAQDIEEMMKEMQAQIDFSQSLTGERLKVTALLKDIVDSLPEKVWITRLSLTNPLVKTRDSSLRLELTGNAMAAVLAQEQDLAFKFRENLSKSPAIGKFFKEFPISVKGQPLAADQTRGLDPASLTQALEKRTQFTIIAETRTPR